MSKIKSGEPVKEKYAGVSISGENLLHVPFLVANRLKRAGYDWRGEYYYSNDGNLSCKSTSINWNASDNAVSAPTLEEAKKWLQTKGVIINVYCRSERVTCEDGKHYDYVATKEWMRSIFANIDGKSVQVKRPITPFLSEDDALVISIREGVNVLLKEEK